MTVLPIANYVSDNARSEGEVKQFLEDVRGVVAELLGGAEPSGLTIDAAGAVTPTGAVHTVDTFGGASSDNLETVAVTNHPAGRFLLLKPESPARVVTIAHNPAGGIGAIETADGAAFALDGAGKWILLWRNTNQHWIEVTRSWGTDENGARSALGVIWGGTSTGSANAQTVSPAKPLRAYGAGNLLFYIPGQTNSGALVINTSGLGNRAVHRDGADLAGGETIAGRLVGVYDDGTRWQLLSTPTARPTIAAINNGPFQEALIDNGDFAIWQRSTSAAETGANFEYIAADRFGGHTDGALLVRSRVPDVPVGEGFLHSLQVTGGGGATASYVVYRMPSVNAIKLKDVRAMTFSCWLKLVLGATPSAPTMQILTADGVDDFSTTTLRLTPTLSAPPNDTWVRHSFVFDPATITNWTQGVEFRLVVSGANALSNGARLAKTTGWALHYGRQPGAFPIVDPALMLERCRRRYWQTRSGSGSFGSVLIEGNATGAGQASSVYMGLPTEMAATPTIAVTGVWAQNNCTGPSVAGFSEAGVVLRALSSGAGPFSCYPNTLDDRVTFDAEL